MHKDVAIITPRQLRFRLPKNLPKYWNDGCAVKTHLFNAIAVITPAFERLAISSVIPFMDKAEEPLRQQLKGFVKQESAHGSEFIRYNLILKSQGYAAKKLEKDSLATFKRMAGLFSPKMHLSLTLAAEHITALISDLLLRDNEWLGRADPAIAAIWRWHAIEEIEHKAVVFDLYKAIKGGKGTRMLGMLLTTFIIGGRLVYNFLYLAWQDRLLFQGAFWKQWVKVCWGKAGFWRKLIKPYLRYYQWNFHPWQTDNHDLITDWKNQFNDMQSFDEMVQALKKGIRE